MHYERAGIISVSEFLDMIPEGELAWKHYVTFFGYRVNMRSARYRCFKNSGIICRGCGLEASFFALERQVKNISGNWHFNLYGIDSYGDEVLFTKDHIVPKSKGGSNHWTNYQTMCIKCNLAKGDKLERVDEDKNFRGLSPNCSS